MIYLTLTLWKAFFVHCIQPDEVDSFRTHFAEDIFVCMELSGQPYPAIEQMPYKRMIDYLKWKTKLEEDKNKRFEEATIKKGKHGKLIR